MATDPRMGEPSLAELAGHTPAAQRRIVGLLNRYRREGLTGLRATVEHRLSGTDGELALAEIADDLVEAILTLAERAGARAAGRRAWEDFDRGEAQEEIERERRGGA